MTVPNGEQCNGKSVGLDEARVFRRIVSEFPAACVVAGYPGGGAAAQWVGSGIPEICGYDSTELEDDPDLWINIIHPLDRERVLDSYRRLAEGAHVREEYRIYRKDGQMRWVAETGVPSTATTMGLVPSIRCVTDITGIRSEAEPDIDFKALVDESPVAIAVRDLDRRVIYCNKASAKLFGFASAEDMLGTTFDDVTSPECAKNLRERLWPLMLAGPWSGETEITPKDGEKVQLKVSINRFLDADGKPSALYSILTDITELKRTEDALRASEELLRRRYDAVSAGVIVHDHEGKIVYSNKAASEILRHPSEDLLEMTSADLQWSFVREDGSPLPIDELPVSVTLRTGLPTRGAIIGCSCPIHEVCRWLTVNSEPVFNPAGDQITEVLVTFLDITKSKQTEAALRESEEKYRSLVDNVDAVIFRLDPEYRPIALGGSVEARMGRAAEEMLQDYSLWFEAVHEEDRDHVRATYEEAAATGLPKAYEIRLINGRTGDTLWVRSHITPRFDDAGRLVHFDGVSVDITERVAAQQREARRAAGMAILTDVSQQFASSLDAQEILDIATRRLCETLDSVSVGITIDPSSGHLQHLSICCPGDCEIANVDHAVRRSGLKVEDVLGPGGLTPRLVPELREMSAIAADLVDAACLSNAQCLGPAVVAPVSAGVDAVGALFSARVTGREFEQEDLWLLTEIASHASAALASAALYKRQSRIAETLQRSLMPIRTEAQRLDVATLYSPAPGEVEVGGDFLDIFPLNHMKVGLVVGDVSGKGVEAAVHTAEAKYMLRAFVHQNSDPGYVMSSLNEALCNCLPDETFITLVYFVIDAERRTIDYVNAGHEASLVLCREANTVREMRPSGPMLGVTKDATFRVDSVPFDADDTLFCYTDGVTDVRVNGGRFGYERLYEAVATAPHGDSKSTMEHVMGKVRASGQSRQTDDQVVVVVRPLV
jgi:PAS domain S-box-containing protein